MPWQLFGYSCVIVMADFKKLKTTSAPFSVIGIEAVTWVEPKLVCEVIYQMVTRDCL